LAGQAGRLSAADRGDGGRSTTASPWREALPAISKPLRSPCWGGYGWVRGIAIPEIAWRAPCLLAGV